MGESLVYGERAHFLSEAVAGFKRLLEVVSCNFDGECVSDHLAGTLVVFNPGGMRKSDPYGTHVDEIEIDGIGMAGRDGDDQGLVDAVNFFLVQRSTALKFSYMEKASSGSGLWALGSGMSELGLCVAAESLINTKDTKFLEDGKGFTTEGTRGHGGIRLGPFCDQGIEFTEQR